MFVDDTCCALATSDIDRFHRHINLIEPHIQFTVEVETNGQQTAPSPPQSTGSPPPPKSQGAPPPPHTHTDRYLDFSSHHPQAHKAAVVHTLMSRAQSLPSSILASTDDEVRVTTALQSNGYPLKFIRISSTPTGAVPDDGTTETKSGALS